MIKFISSIFILFILISKNCLSNNIAVIDVDEIINSYETYKKTLILIENNQKINSDVLKEKEIELENLLNEIEQSKILLEESELNNLIDNYNLKLSEFSKDVDNFNLHYQEQILQIRKIVLQEIIVLAEKYAKDNNISLVIDSTNYLIASNDIDITDTIKNKLSKIILELEFKNFEKN